MQERPTPNNINHEANHGLTQRLQNITTNIDAIFEGNRIKTVIEDDRSMKRSTNLQPPNELTSVNWYNLPSGDESPEKLESYEIRTRVGETPFNLDAMVLTVYVRPNGQPNYALTLVKERTNHEGKVINKSLTFLPLTENSIKEFESIFAN